MTATVEVEVEPPTMEVLTANKDRSRSRMEAMLLYVTTLENITIQSLHKDPRFKKIPIQTFHRWAADDGWVAQRKAFFANLYQGLEKRLANTLTTSLYKEVQHLMKVRDLTFDALTEKDDDGNLKLKAKTFEGAAKVLMETNKRLDEIRRQVVTDFLPGQAGAVATPEEEEEEKDSMFQYSSADIQTATRAILAERRAAIRAKAGDQDDNRDGPDIDEAVGSA